VGAIGDVGADLLDRVRARIADERVLALVKAFCKAGILTGAQALQDSDTGTPQGGIFSVRASRTSLIWNAPCVTPPDDEQRSRDGRSSGKRAGWQQLATSGRP
jgi:hypothetical protein